MSAKVKASEVQAESAKDIKDEAVELAEAEAAKKAEADAKTKAEKEAQAKAEQAEAKAKVKDGKTYIAQWTLHHDNTRYVTGDTLTLSDDDAEDLVDAGVLVATK